MAILLVRQKNNVVDRIPLYKDSFLIGRALENDLILTDTASSRRHTQITKGPSGYFIEDMKSANGTVVNGNLINLKQPLNPGDVVRIGDTELVFQDDPKPAPARSPAASPIPGGVPIPGKELGTSQIIKPVAEVATDLERSIIDLNVQLKEQQEAVKTAPEVAMDQNFRILFQLSKILTSTSTADELYETGMRLVMDVLKAERGVLKLLDPKTNQLITMATRVKGDIKCVAGNIEISSTISNKVIQDKVSIMTADAQNDPRFLEGQSIVAFNIRSALCVPLWDDKVVRGIVYVDNLMETNTFSETDLDLLTAVAHQIAIGVKKEELNQKISHEAVVRSNLERFHSAEELEVILESAHSAEEGKLAMREGIASVLFSDICSFTPMSEKMTPQEVANLLNSYFSTMTKIIFKNKGSVNKYIGDGIMATFGALTENENGAVNAVRAGCEMVSALMEMNKTIPPEKQFKIRVGINTGPVVVGMLGPIERMEFTVLGDTVNVASRLESAAQPMSVCFGEETYRHAQGKFRISELGETQLKGKSGAAQLYGVLLEQL